MRKAEILTKMLLCVIIITLAGCTSTTIIKRSGQPIFEITSQDNAVVIYNSKQTGEEVKVDNRGESSVMDKVIELMTLTWIGEKKESDE